MEEPTHTSPENVSPMTDLSRNMTTLRTLNESSWSTTPQVPSRLNMSSPAAATPDSAGSAYRLKMLTPKTTDYSSESEAEPSPLVNLHKRVILAQVNKSSSRQSESPFFIARVTSASRSKAMKRSSLEFKEESSPMRKNSSQGYCSSASDGFALDEIILEDDNVNKENREPVDTLASLLSAPINNESTADDAERETSSINNDSRLSLIKGKRVNSARRNLSFNQGQGHHNETPIKSKRTDHDGEKITSKRSRLCLTERTNVSKKLPKFYSESNIDREAAEDVIDKGVVELIPTIGAHKRCALPTISVQTLHEILNGKFDHVIESYVIIDCRWPYEFDGGHIQGAKNLYTHELVYKEFLEKNALSSRDDHKAKKNIIIFHCEFSSERGPKMSQYLREKDREQNVYPQLYYPEVYILKGGYKEFFDSFKEFCVPQEYLKMVDDRFSDECRLYRSQSKSFEKKSFSRNQSSRF